MNNAPNQAIEQLSLPAIRCYYYPIWASTRSQNQTVSMELRDYATGAISSVALMSTCVSLEAQHLAAHLLRSLLSIGAPKHRVPVRPTPTDRQPLRRLLGPNLNSFRAASTPTHEARDSPTRIGYWSSLAGGSRARDESSSRAPLWHLRSATLSSVVPA